MYKFSFIVFFLIGSSLQAQIKNSVLQKEKQSPMMGWASWYTYRADIDQQKIRMQIDAFEKSGLKEFGYDYINIDDGFFGGRNDNGELIPHPIRFPGGMKAIADYIHAKGLKAGIYTDAGLNTCASYWDKDTIGVGVGLFGHEDSDLKQFLIDWDYDYIKVDWCGGDWLGLDEQTRYETIGRKMKALKPNAKYNVCRWQFPGKWVTQVADSWRISGDIRNTFEAVMHTIDLNADLWPYASNGHYNDMDMLQIGRGMSIEEEKTQFTMWCLMHSPLILGNDMSKIDNSTIKIITNKDLIDINQDDYVYQARRIIDEGDFEIWARPLVSTMSGEVVVALLNRSNNESKISFAVDSIGLNGRQAYSTKDLWSKEIATNQTNSKIERVVPPHGVVVLKIKGKSLPFNVFQFGKNPN